MRLILGLEQVLRCMLGMDVSEVTKVIGRPSKRVEHLFIAPPLIALSLSSEAPN